MKKNHLLIITILIWVTLILAAVFEYDFYIESYKGSNTTRDCTVGGGVTGLSCTASVLAYGLAKAAFWGIFSTVLLWNVVSIDNDEEEGLNS